MLRPGYRSGGVKAPPPRKKVKRPLAKGLLNPRRSGGVKAPPPRKKNPAPVKKYPANPIKKAPNPPVAPPDSPETMAIRQSAERDWANAQLGIKDALYQAALAYGDPALIAQYGPAVASEANPNSAINQITRQKAEANRVTGEQANAGGTFFSGLHGRDQNRINDEAAANMAAAYSTYMNAFNEQERARLEALGSYSDELNRADVLDIAANTEREFTAAVNRKKKKKKKAVPKKKGKGKKR